MLLLPLAATSDAPCDRPHACEPIILVPGVMGSRLRSYSRVAGSIDTVARHAWLPESHRLLQRSAIVGRDMHKQWVASLMPRSGRKAGTRIEPDRANWGIKGVACILKTGRECSSGAKIFWDMVLHLEKAGYRAGTTLYGLPFDWRLAPTENKICPDLAHLLHHVTNTTSYRKAVLVAHSLGNLQLLYCMQNVFGTETISKIKSLVSIAAPWAGSPQVVRVLFSGAEMVSRFIISDAETRDIARQMAGVQMLIPEERVWGNFTILEMQGGADVAAALAGGGGVGAAVASAAATATAAGSRGGGDGAPPSGEAESYRGSRDELLALFAKIEAMGGDGAKYLLETYRQTLGLIDIWRAPPVPVVCVVGSGKPTHVRFGYCDAWPRNMDEAPCALQYEDGDGTVPVRSSDAVCREWQRQQACHAPLSTANAAKFKGRSSECVAIEYLHCRDPSMFEPGGEKAGADHCAEYHSRILIKQPTFDLVTSLAHNPHAHEPGYAPLVAQLHEAAETAAWLYNSAVARLPSAAELQQALAAVQTALVTAGAADVASSANAAPTVATNGGGDGSSGAALLEAAGGARLPSVGGLLEAWRDLKRQHHYRRILELLQEALPHARAAPKPDDGDDNGAGSGAAATAASMAASMAASVTGEATVPAAVPGGGGAAVAAERLRRRTEAAAALLIAVKPLEAAAVACGDFVDVSRFECSRLDEAPQPGRPQTPQAEQQQQQQPATAQDEPVPPVAMAAAAEPLSMLGEAASAGGFPDSCHAYERAEHACLRETHRQLSAAEAAERVRGVRRAMCEVEAAMAPHVAPLEAVRAQLRWCVHHLQRLAEQLRRPDEPQADAAAAASAGGPTGATYESALYGQLEDDGVMSSKR